MEFPQRTAPLRPVRTKVKVARSELIWLRDEARRLGLVWTGRPHLGALVRPWIHAHVVRIARRQRDDWPEPGVTAPPAEPLADLWVYLDPLSRNLITAYAGYFRLPRSRILYGWIRPHLPNPSRRAA